MHWTGFQFPQFYIWHDGRAGFHPSGSLTDDAGLATGHRHRALHGGSGSDNLQPRASHGGCGADGLQHLAFACAYQVPDGIGTAYEYGEHLERDQLEQLHAEHVCQALALLTVHGEHPCQAWVPTAALGGVCGQDWAQHGAHGVECSCGVHQNGPAHPCLHAGHGVGGGGVGDGSKMGLSHELRPSWLHECQR